MAPLQELNVVRNVHKCEPTDGTAPSLTYNLHKDRWFLSAFAVSGLTAVHIPVPTYCPAHLASKTVCSHSPPGPFTHQEKVHGGMQEEEQVNVVLKPALTGTVYWKPTPLGPPWEMTECRYMDTKTCWAFHLLWCIGLSALYTTVHCGIGTI